VLNAYFGPDMVPTDVLHARIVFNRLVPDPDNGRVLLPEQTPLYKVFAETRAQIEAPSIHTNTGALILLFNRVGVLARVRAIAKHA
jgi:hypothetical protein